MALLLHLMDTGSGRSLTLLKLVDRKSATLLGYDSLRLSERNHVMMNKFEGPCCTDYKLVVGKIQEHLGEIRKGTLVMQMAKALQDHYGKPGTLEIQRLSGRLLPMERYYINLLLVRETRQEGNFTNEDKYAQLSSSFSLTSQLGVQTVDEDVRVDMNSLFERRSGGLEAPTRVLIRGRAGVGKTTLCKKIVHDFLHRKLWNNCFDHIFWVPLRGLKSLNKEVKNTTELLRWEFFRNDTQKGDAIAEEIWRKLHSTEYFKAVFLLDGLDEISDQLDRGNRVYKILESIMELPYVIVTSRPHVSLPECMRREGQFHLELETLGFDSPQVEEYIRGYYVDLELESRTDHQDTPDKILKYLKKYPLIRSLMRIPVQLDALCFTWNAFKDGPEPRTMTDLYNSMASQLWADYLERIKNEVQIKSRARKLEIDFRAKQDREKIEFLAFTGMHSNVIEFEGDHLDKIVSMIKIDPEKIFAQLLGELSFLRSSGGTSYADSDQSYHFIHLTYQEYFAARYFARQWESKKEIECLHLISGERKSLSPAHFLRDYKYQSRYGIFWRFVAGLLDSNPSHGSNLARLGRGSDIVEFFRTLDQRPLDLLGSSHQRLIMCCLSEVKSESFPFRKKLEHNLSNWLVFDCKMLLPDPDAQSPDKHLLGMRFGHRRALTLASEDEFPDGALTDSLSETDEIKAIIFSSLKRRVQIPSEITDKAISLLEQTKSKNLTTSILRMIRHIEELPARSLPIIYNKLQSPDPSEAMSAKETLETQLPLSFLRDKIEDAKRPDRTLNPHQCWVLGNRQYPVEIMDDLIGMLNSDDALVNENAIEILKRHTFNFSETVLDTLWLQIQRHNRHTQRQDLQTKKVQRSLQALSGQSELPSKFISLLLYFCRVGDRTYSAQAFALLLSLSQPPDEELSQYLASKAHGTVETKWVRNPSGSRAWCEVELSETTIKNLVITLDSHAAGIMPGKHLILKQMEKRRTIEEPILRAILNGRDGYDAEGRKLAIRVLDHQMELPNQILIVNHILDTLDTGKSPQKAVLEALRIFKNYPHLPVKELERIRAYMNHTKLSIRKATLNTLGVQLNLTGELFNEMSDCIEDPNTEIASAAMQAIINSPLMNSSVLKEVLIKIQERMRDSEEFRQAAVQALGRRSDLSEVSEDFVSLLLARLKTLLATSKDTDESHRLIRDVTLGLGKQSHLSPHALEELAQICNSQTSRISAIDQLIYALSKMEGFHSHFLLCSHKDRILLPLLGRSLRETLCWQISDGQSYLEELNVVKIAGPSHCLRIKDIEEEMQMARGKLGVPPVAVLSSSES